MIFWGLSIIFFVVTFGPRFFTLMNFGYGFDDLGLYSEGLAKLSKLQFDPMITTYGTHFYGLKPQPIFLFFLPISFFTTSPSFFLFLDETALLLAAAACSHLALRKTSHIGLSVAIFFAVLFCSQTLLALHAPASVMIWAQAPLAWLLFEFYTKRRAGWMAFWFFVLCLVDLRLSAIGLFFAPLCLLTEKGRWNWHRRLSVFLPVAVVTAGSFFLLRQLNLDIAFDGELLRRSPEIFLVFPILSFLFAPLLCLELVVLGILFWVIKGGSRFHDMSILVPIMAMASVVGLERWHLNKAFVMRLLTLSLVSSTLYFNFMSKDPFFSFWKLQNRSISAPSREVHKLLGKISAESFVAASDRLTPHLASCSVLTTLATSVRRQEQPQCVVTLIERSSFERNPNYELLDATPDGALRILRKIR